MQALGNVERSKLIPAIEGDHDSPQGTTAAGKILQNKCEQRRNS